MQTETEVIYYGEHGDIDVTPCFAVPGAVSTLPVWAARYSSLPLPAPRLAWATMRLWGDPPQPPNLPVQLPRRQRCSARVAIPDQSAAPITDAMQYVRDNLVDWALMERAGVEPASASTANYLGQFLVLRDLNGQELCSDYRAGLLYDHLGVASVSVVLNPSSGTPIHDPEAIATALDRIAAHIRAGGLLPGAPTVAFSETEN